MNQERISVIGAGTMGHSIALSAAWSGFMIDIWGNDEADIERGRKAVQEKVKVLQEYEAVTAEEARQITERIHFSPYMEDVLEEATFVIEAAPEHLPLKQELFQKLDAICSPSVVLASNTSGLSPTKIAERTVHADRTIVTHFWNPAHLLPLVEVIRGERTSDATLERAMDLLRAMDKKPIVVKKDVLGSIGNRLQYALFREAQNLLEQGVATVEEIDAAVRYSIGRRLPVTGPFMTADMGGLDVFDAISNYLFPDFSNAQQSLETMRTLVDNGHYGQKNGKGFYEWTPSFSEQMNRERERELIEWAKKDRQK
ncbi:3-hydroxyacyl-CoA dehydrogenase family protein [Aneurinibacillus danicus]|jgi:3-hydroxybutyryl-CoA dehydrogenase|uniref:3-hydroxybutyryl-CoA dehydrogenase n=1 Tax=Aneurinibacillus danicus TaxID=267746 RepID=A0A511VA96_9BACL|nr:3-hydroxyacyl-CoA dehydrogenase NAD-binding domain-containing protein [Aneurinibacillus danicus]GEN35847.1 3-hydroxybutyryl-CoA dehydrogenase [Aneurinibacillus danicus]